MALSQTTTSLAALASVTFIGAPLQPIFLTSANGEQNQRGFKSITRAPLTPKGVFDLRADFGLDPKTMDISCTPNWEPGAGFGLSASASAALIADPLNPGSFMVRVTTEVTPGPGASQSGTGTLVAGSAVIPTTQLDPVTDQILISRKDAIGTAGDLSVPLATRLLNTSFTVLSANALDLSTFDWELIHKTTIPGAPPTIVQPGQSLADIPFWIEILTFELNRL